MKELPIIKKVGVGFLIVMGILFFLFLVVRYVQPFDGMITEDRSIIEKLCKIGDKCEVGEIAFYCNQIWDNPSRYQNLPTKEKRIANKLKNWGGYRGCNESTEGFLSNGRDYIVTNGCGCGGYA